jgi:predicted nucleic acid-binding protein
VVIDASSAVALLLGDGDPVELEVLRSGAAAPALLDVEVHSTARGLLRGGRLAPDAARELLDDLRTLPVQRFSTDPLLEAAWELRDVCSTYDALYVVLAQALDVPLLTRDRRLARAVDGLVGVRLSG